MPELQISSVEASPVSKIRPIRILMAKPGLDGHDRGALVVSRALRDAGFEVIYLGLYGKIDQIVQIAIQEDVDIIGLSILSGTHLKVAKRLVSEIRKRRNWKVLTAIGGIIPEADLPKLKRLGIDVVVPTGTPISQVGEVLKLSLEARVKKRTTSISKEIPTMRNRRKQ
jgi:methylmalonyl-CoA mutase, C-terminal domain